MKLHVVLTAALCLAISCASGHNSDFDSKLPVVRDLAGYNAKLHILTESNDSLQMESIGAVEYPGFRADLYAVRYTPKEIPERTILITGGVHGNEPAGAGFTLNLIQALSDGTAAFKNVRVEIIPMINPWGWVHDSRYNYRGMDINRDFASFKTQEAKIIGGYVKGRAYDMAIDHHEDPDASGVYLYQYGRQDTMTARNVLTAVRDLGFPIEQDVNMIILKTEDGLIDAPMWGLRYMRLTKQLSISNYLRLENSTDVYTVETPVKLPIKDRVEIHELVFGMLSE